MPSLTSCHLGSQCANNKTSKNLPPALRFEAPEEETSQTGLWGVGHYLPLEHQAANREPSRCYRGWIHLEVIH